MLVHVIAKYLYLSNYKISIFVHFFSRKILRNHRENDINKTTKEKRKDTMAIPKRVSNFNLNKI